jgi:hypothetical protein
MKLSLLTALAAVRLIVFAQDTDNKPALPASNAWLQDTTLNFYFDGYYAWNANRPANRVNALRAYDVTANNFGLNQAGVVVERVPDSSSGKRWGYRLDLMFGQATDVLQGSPANEPRPDIYRHVFQAYGTYVVPIGKGLTADFGKWASALGPEGNYSKDQINYSRSYFFNFLPFYHMGLRTTYPVNDKLSLGYWLVNGVNQTEDFNGYKSQLAQVIIKPTKRVTWNLLYYNGREQPTQQDGYTPRGRMHIIDTYAFWNPNDKVTIGGEFDSVINRVESSSSPRRVTGGAAYFKYQFTKRLFFGQRYTRLNDIAGWFSGASQNFNEVTSTVGFRPHDGFEGRAEYRRDFSDVAYFARRTGGHSTHQDTFTLALLWWFGGKQGGW